MTSRTLRPTTITLVNAAVLTGAMLLVASTAHAQSTAPYNEAVRVIKGKRVVEAPPHTKADDPTGDGWLRPAEHPELVAAVMEVETPEGLMDCAGLWFYHPKACSPTSFGRTKLRRQWVVLYKGRWQVCASQAAPTSCAPIIRDGVLRPFPVGEIE